MTTIREQLVDQITAPDAYKERVARFAGNAYRPANYGMTKLDGRGGGVITGDKVTLDTRERCACGRFGPTLLDNISRFAQLGEQDHIGCVGTIDSYMRGTVGEPQPSSGAG